VVIKSAMTAPEIEIGTETPRGIGSVAIVIVIGTIIIPVDGLPKMAARSVLPLAGRRIEIEIDPRRERAERNERAETDLAPDLPKEETIERVAVVIIRTTTSRTGKTVTEETEIDTARI